VLSEGTTRSVEDGIPTQSVGTRFVGWVSRVFEAQPTSSWWVAPTPSADPPYVSSKKNPGREDVISILSGCLAGLATAFALLGSRSATRERYYHMRRHLSSALTALLVVSTALIAVRGCSGPRLSVAKVERLHKGMRYAQVVDVLGPPTRIVERVGPAGMQDGQPGAGMNGLYAWENGSAKVLVGFVRGRVSLISSNLRHGS
jgi:hypothetical protein